MMRRVILAFFSFGLLSCQKTDHPAALPDLHNTNWHLHYKYNGFSFFAETELRFHDDTTFENIGVADTVYGHWKIEQDSVKLYFDNSAFFHGVAVTNDSLSGTMFNTLDEGIWSAGRK